MHEQSLMNDLMKKILQLAKQEGATKVTKISVWLGALSHMSKAHFQEHFDQAAKGTIAEKAVIEAELSKDITDPQACSVLLKEIDVES